MARPDCLFKDAATSPQMLGIPLFVAATQIMQRWRNFSGDKGACGAPIPDPPLAAVAAAIPWVAALTAAVTIAVISTLRVVVGGGASGGGPITAPRPLLLPPQLLPPPLTPPPPPLGPVIGGLPLLEGLAGASE